MKKFLLLTVISVALFSFKTADNVPAIINALKIGSAEEVGKYFDNFIDLKLPEKDEIKNMGKNQASIALQSFFKDNGIKGFELTSQREMGASMYLAGKLQNAGKGYNITILLKTKDGDKEIITVRIN
ncbi:MAG: DUF4783 domain-containing protein [Pedobacter sp.]|nr:DUF4783 domain-containing protein [Chitinophagaceae bacterium]